MPGVHQPFIDLIAEAIKKKICDAQWWQEIATKLGVSAPVEKFVSSMAILEALDCEETAKKGQGGQRRPRRGPQTAHVAGHFEGLSK